MCLENGKHVLCEKSFAVTASQAEELFSLAREKKLFIMEAFWTKFLPAYRLLEKTIADGTIGDLTHIRAEWGFAPAGARYVRKFDPLLAGGALLDIGVYTIGVAAMFLGYTPKNIYSSAIIGEYGTDKFTSVMLEYENGATAHLISTIGSVIEPKAVIYGTKGHIILPNFASLERFTVMPDSGHMYSVEAFFEISGFEYQIKETYDCLLAGKITSEIMRREDTVSVMKIMDKVRETCGIKYPFEK
jgi:predicted dehydrogenase